MIQILVIYLITVVICFGILAHLIKKEIKEKNVLDNEDIKIIRGLTYWSCIPLLNMLFIALTIKILWED